MRWLFSGWRVRTLLFTLLASVGAGISIRIGDPLASSTWAFLSGLWACEFVWRRRADQALELAGEANKLAEEQNAALGKFAEEVMRIHRSGGIPGVELHFETETFSKSKSN